MLASLQLPSLKKLPKEPYWCIVKWHLVRHRWREKKLVSDYLQEADGIGRHYRALADLTPEALIHQLNAMRLHALAGQLSAERLLLHKTLALLQLASVRLLGMEPYQVQMAAILAMFDGYLVQLAPGEGKTLTIGLLAILFGWSNRPCHVITANDYLAERDATELAPLYEFCSVSVATVLQTHTQEEKPTQYLADVVYSTAKQLLADYLTDQITFGGSVTPLTMSVRMLQGQTAHRLLMRGIHTAIVDEADNILIDEAITPMIISGADHNPVLHEAILVARTLVDRLQSPRDYQCSSLHRDVRWTTHGEQLMEKMAQELPPIWRGRHRRHDLFTQAVLARDYFLQDQHYVVLDDEVVIVDEGTGRPMPGRSWSYGLHQAVEARAGVPLTHPNKTLARMSFQNYFKHYVRLTGASGTLQNIAHELFFNYRIRTLRIPSRLPSQLIVQPFQLFVTKQEKELGLLNLLRELLVREIPVLVGTRTIEDSEQLAGRLDRERVKYQLLNAKKLTEEADIVARAGEKGQLTIATNMAGRGTDIKLSREVMAAGGLRVIMMEPHESARIDWQLFGRAGRQGNPGEAYPLVSLEDGIMRAVLPKCVLRVLCSLAEHWPHNKLWTTMIRLTQHRAELKAFRLRRFMNTATRESQKRMTFTSYE
ncbi:hypothetical protein [Chrysiogenes arsenatis]|uniref:preprotein translocase subunit SecA n=1 Tax=Chrysiogenes arsenatis TaxID=309797 RepID=UPI00041F513F|nr:hypothetical protein [Chrysiogenes arsenatis]